MHDLVQLPGNGVVESGNASRDRAFKVLGDDNRSLKHLLDKLADQILGSSPLRFAPRDAAIFNDLIEKTRFFLDLLRLSRFCLEFLYSLQPFYFSLSPSPPPPASWLIF